MTRRWTAAIMISALAAAVPSTARGQSSEARFEILDNSFLVEEAFNQEKGVYQNIFGATRSPAGRWDGAFTQEWPVGGPRHQASYTLPFAVLAGGSAGLGDVLINYRYQLLFEHGRVPAVAPRVSIVLPSGRADGGYGSGVVGWQVNLPLSKEIGNVYLHANAGATYLPGVRANASDDRGTSLVSPTVAASAIVQVRPMLNLMCEVVAASNESLAGPGVAARETTVTVSPGLRGGWNLGARQVVVGAAIPVTFRSGAADVGLLTYASYELPFRRESAKP